MSDRIDKLYDFLNNACLLEAVEHYRLYMSNGKTFVVYQMIEGWEVYVPVSQSSRIDDTLAALKRYIYGEPE